MERQVDISEAGYGNDAGYGNEEGYGYDIG